MKWWEIVSVILGSGGFVALLTFITKRLERKDNIKDKENGTAKELAELKSDTDGKFIEVNGRIDEVEHKVEMISDKTDANSIGTKAQLFNTISYLGNKYIKAGKTDPEEYQRLIELYEGYRELHKGVTLTNGAKASYDYLAHIIELVNQLQFDKGS